MKFIIEQSAYSGVLKIAGKVAQDMELDFLLERNLSGSR